MSWLTDVANQLKGVGTGWQTGINKAFPALQKTGGTLTEMYKQSAPEEYRNIFWDPSRDTGPNASYRVATFADQLAAGKNPFAGEGEIEYNQNMAKRAAIVASIFGGAALAGGAGAGSAAAGAGEAGAAAGAGETGAAAAGGGATGGGTVAPTTAYGLGAGNVGGATLSGAAGGTAGTYTPVMSAAGPAAAGGGGAGTAAAGGSWGPYAQAGGTILSTLFQGLMQMEQAKEQRDMEIRMAKAKANIERAQAENAALDRLIQIWGRRA